MTDARARREAIAQRLHRLARPAPAIAHWASSMLESGAAVILDVETADVDGPICEAAVLDTDGTTLLDVLVDPGESIAASASAIHGITDDDITGAPDWEGVLPQLVQATSGRQILAYNAGFDRAAVAIECGRLKLEPGYLAEPENWTCLMLARARWSHMRYAPPLRGPHRALGDCWAGLRLLRSLAEQ